MLHMAMHCPPRPHGMKRDGSAVRCPHSTDPDGTALRSPIPLILMALPCTAPDGPACSVPDGTDPGGTACSVLTNISDPNSTVLLCPPCHWPIVTHPLCPVPVEVMGDNTTRPGQVDAVSAEVKWLVETLRLFSVSQNASLHPWCWSVKGTAKLCPS